MVRVLRPNVVGCVSVCVCAHTQSLTTLEGEEEAGPLSATLPEASLAYNTYLAGDAISQDAKYGHLP